MVPTSYPLALMLRNKDASGRIGKWPAELVLFDLTFIVRTTIKSQALTDFVAEWNPQFEEQPPNQAEAPWKIYTNGSWCTAGAGAVAFLELSFFCHHLI